MSGSKISHIKLIENDIDPKYQYMPIYYKEDGLYKVGESIMLKLNGSLSYAFPANMLLTATYIN